MIRRILIPLDPSPYTDSAVELGCAIAAMNGAELTGLVILDIPGIEEEIGPVPLGGLHYAEKLEKARQTEAKERIHLLLEKFRAACGAKGIPNRESERQGSPSERIIQESFYYDLLIMGLRTFFHFETEEKPGDSLLKVLDHTVTAVCAVPKEVRLPDLAREKMRVLLAFDGSLPAARALQQFADLGTPETMRVTLLMSHDDEHTAAHLLYQAEAYLRSHGYRDVTTKTTDENIIQAVDEEYARLADLIVVGAHSKKGLFDFVTGSLTRHLIEEERLPVIIGQ
jgi:nucleotide-binding universal stress UspA family protein